MAICVSGWSDLSRPAMGRAVALPSARVGRSARRDRRRAPCRTDQARDLPFVPPLVCDPSSRTRIGHPDGAGTAWPQRCQHDDGVHACAESRTAGSSESGRSASAALDEGTAWRGGQRSVGGGFRPMGHRVFAAMHGGMAGDVFVLACGPTRSYGLLSWLLCEHRGRGRLRPWLFSGCRLIVEGRGGPRLCEVQRRPGR